MNSAAINPVAASDAGDADSLPEIVGGGPMGWSAAKVGMAIFLCNEAVFFATLVLAYITYIGATTSGPTPAESLSLPLAILNTVLLISSSVTVTFAVKAMERNSDESNDWTKDFAFWLTITIGLGSDFCW